MSNQERTDNRPESFDDLPQDQYDTKPKRVASIELDVKSIGSGLLAAAEQVIIALRAVHGDALIVATDNGGVTADRPLTAEEKAEVLERYQKNWDERVEQETEAKRRAHLKVGDAIEVAKSVLVCRAINKDADCDLNYSHVGDHFKVVDGLVAKRIKRVR